MSAGLRPPVRVAGCGAGYFSQFHYNSWQRLPDATLVGVCDLDVTRAKQHGTAAYNSLDRMLEAQSPDILDIIVPPASQARAIHTALAHGIPWLICQKPFCSSLDEARAITEAVESADAQLIVHENVRFQPWYRVIKQTITDGRIGQPLQGSFQLRPGDGQGPNAYLERQPYFQSMPRFLVHETAVHWIDTFQYLFGAPSAVYADLRRINPAIAGEDAGYILFDHPEGVRTVFDGNRALDHNATDQRKTLGEARLEGTEGCLSLSGDGAVTLRQFGATTATTLLPPDRHDQFGGDCVHHLQNHVISVLLHGTKPENTARDYLQIIKIEEAIYASAEAGQKLSLDTM